MVSKRKKGDPLSGQLFGSVQKAGLPGKVGRVKQSGMETPRGRSGLFFQLDPLLHFHQPS